MAMTDAEFDKWVDGVVQEAVDDTMRQVNEYIESGELDREVEEDFAEEEKRVAELEAQGLDEPADDDSDIEQ